MDENRDTQYQRHAPMQPAHGPRAQTSPARRPGLRRRAVGLLAGLLTVGALAAIPGAIAPAAAQPRDHVVSPSAVRPDGAPGGGGNHLNVPPGSAIWPGNMNPDAGTSSDTGPIGAAPIDSGDHPRDAPGADSPRS